MSVEDRLRTATRARADLVSDIRPLDLPAREPARLRRAPGSRRWMAWAAPAAAAALVVALALTLVSIRQARNESPIPAAAQPGAAAISAAGPIPEFYAALNSPLGGGPTPVVVGKTGASAVMSTVRPPKGQSFVGVTGAADDRTFVVAAEAYPALPGAYSGAPVAWYLLRVPAVGQAARLTKLTIPGQPAGTQVSGIALSPNGGELAILFQRGVWAGRSGPLTLSVYSVSTGRALRTWTQQANGARVGFGWYFGQYSNTSITWQDARTLAFDEGVYSPPGAQPNPAFAQLDPSFSDVKIRTLSLSSPGGSLLADSKVVFSLQELLVRHPAAHARREVRLLRHLGRQRRQQEQRLRPEDLRVHGRDRQIPPRVPPGGRVQLRRRQRPVAQRRRISPVRRGVRRDRDGPRGGDRLRGRRPDQQGDPQADHLLGERAALRRRDRLLIQSALPL